jgi:hypothetical protein
LGVSVQPSPRVSALHTELVTACVALRRSEHEVARLLVQAEDEGLHRQHGYARLADYAEAELALSRRKALDLVRIGRAMPGLPHLERAFSEGRLPWTRAREILPVLTLDNEEAWVREACERSNRELESAVRDTLGGEPPPTHVGDLAPARTRLVFESGSTDAETVRAAIQWMRASTGVSRDEVDDGAILAALVQRAMEAAPPEEAPSAERYRVVVEHCPGCGRTRGTDAELPDAVVAEAACDAEVVEMRAGPERGHHSSTVPPARRRAVSCRDRHRCRVPECTNRVWLDVHHVRQRARGGGHGEDNLVTLCTVHHRLVHEGRLGLTVSGADLVVTFATGRVERRPGSAR